MAARRQACRVENGLRVKEIESINDSWTKRQQIIAAPSHRTVINCGDNNIGIRFTDMHRWCNKEAIIWMRFRPRALAETSNRRYLIGIYEQYANTVDRVEKRIWLMVRIKANNYKNGKLWGKGRRGHSPPAPPYNFWDPRPESIGALERRSDIHRPHQVATGCAFTQRCHSTCRHGNDK